MVNEFDKIIEQAIERKRSADHMERLRVEAARRKLEEEQAENAKQRSKTLDKWRHDGLVLNDICQSINKRAGETGIRADMTEYKQEEVLVRALNFHMATPVQPMTFKLDVDGAFEVVPNITLQTLDFFKFGDSAYYNAVGSRYSTLLLQ